jgi:hypothetical protein
MSNETQKLPMLKKINSLTDKPQIFDN